jgi:hypothetical protein
VPCSRTRERRNGASRRGTKSASFFGYGSGKDWKALSARRPSPVIIRFVSLERGLCVRETYQRKGQAVSLELQFLLVVAPQILASPTQLG